MLTPYKNKTPDISPYAYILDNVTVIGDVHVGNFSSVWYGSVLRGDVNRITVGKYSNIQDGCVVHVNDDTDTFIGDYVTIGHRAIIHGCHIGDYVLVGMGSVIMDGVKIGDNVIIGAGTLITIGKEIPPNTMVYGSPANVVRELTKKEIDSIKESALKYARLASDHYHF